jgi:SAM-dependent methyltransferase
MQQFHNIIVKRKTQIDIVKKIGQDRMNILDIGCGKGGDISKWIDVGKNIVHVVGIDKSSQNILDISDGACVRYEQIKEKKTMRVPEFTFLVGDCSKNIFNGSCFSDDRSIDIYKRMWDQSMGAATHFKQNKFNIINIQFAIHYFFESMATLDGFMENINQNLKQDGYLLGTCFDGNLVFNALRALSNSELLVGTHNKNIIWKIKKEYDLEELPEDGSSVGIPISVFIKSINNTIREYLVSFTYLRRRLANIGIRLINDSEAVELGITTGTGTFKELYDQHSGDSKYNFIFKNFGPDQQRFSFMYRYFIFKRISSDPIELDDKAPPAPPAAPDPVPAPAPAPAPVALVDDGLSPAAKKWKTTVMKLISKLKPKIDIADQSNSAYLSSKTNTTKYKQIIQFIKKAISKHSDEFGPDVAPELQTLHDLLDILVSR